MENSFDQKSEMPQPKKPEKTKRSKELAERSADEQSSENREGEGGWWEDISKVAETLELTPEQLFFRGIGNPEKEMPDLEKLIPGISEKFETSERFTGRKILNIDGTYSVFVDSPPDLWYARNESSELSFLGIPSFYDLYNFLKNPSEAWHNLEMTEKIREIRSELRSLVKELIEQSDVMHIHSSGIYGLESQGSTYNEDILPSLLYYALPEREKDSIYSWLREGVKAKKERKDFAETFKESKPLKGKTVLEIGSGFNARMCEMLESLGAKCVGLDIQESDPHSDIETYQGDITKPDSLPLELRGQKFDFVISIMTFVPEIIDRPHLNRGTRSTLSFLKEDGVAIFSPGISFDDSEENYSELTKSRPYGMGVKTVIKNKPKNELTMEDFL